MKTKFDIGIFPKSKEQILEDQNLYDIKRAQAAVKSVLFSKGFVQRKFFTDDSGLYEIPDSKKYSSCGRLKEKRTKTWDGLSSRIVHEYESRGPGYGTSFLHRKYRHAKRKCDALNGEIKEGTRSVLDRISFVHIWNTSIVMSVLFGMFFMSVVYRYMGQSASALEVVDDRQVAYEEIIQEYKEKRKKDKESEWSSEKEEAYINGIMTVMEKQEEENFEKEVWKMVEGYPIEKMVPYILEQDRTVAAFLIGIAKKESNWGKRKPVLNGQDCYNYWGYRGIRERMGSGGHTCFDSPRDAVETVSKRLKWLVEEQNRNTPSKMIIWKCGSSCAGHAPGSPEKWISDVSMYFDRLNKQQ
jgi:hypothetical protein